MLSKASLREKKDVTKLVQLKQIIGLSYCLDDYNSGCCPLMHVLQNVTRIAPFFLSAI